MEQKIQENERKLKQHEEEVASFKPKYGNSFGRDTQHGFKGGIKDYPPPKAATASNFFMGGGVP